MRLVKRGTLTPAFTADTLWLARQMFTYGGQRFLLRSEKEKGVNQYLELLRELGIKDGDPRLNAALLAIVQDGIGRIRGEIEHTRKSVELMGRPVQSESILATNTRARDLSHSSIRVNQLQAQLRRIISLAKALKMEIEEEAVDPVPAR